VSAAATAPETASGVIDWSVAAGDRLLVVRFPAAMQVVSWAIWNGGRRRVPAVAWVGVTNAELPPEVDPRALCQSRLRAAGLEAAVGLLTSGQLARYRRASASAEGVGAQALATVGLSNALRAGDPPGFTSAGPSEGPAPPAMGSARQSRATPDANTPVGTINILCAVSVPLSEEAALEALSIAVEARTAAVLEGRHPSRRSGALATGTGTDCVVLAWPEPVGTLVPAVFAGKHTALGHVIGRSVGDCVRAGVADWLEAYACR
jgi:adenosylcobinamide amidohydrolase